MHANRDIVARLEAAWAGMRHAAERHTSCSDRWLGGAPQGAIAGAAVGERELPVSRLAASPLDGFGKLQDGRARAQRLK